VIASPQGWIYLDKQMYKGINAPSELPSSSFSHVQNLHLVYPPFPSEQGGELDLRMKMSNDEITLILKLMPHLKSLTLDKADKKRSENLSPNRVVNTLLETNCRAAQQLSAKVLLAPYRSQSNANGPLAVRQGCMQDKPDDRIKRFIAHVSVTTPPGAPQCFVTRPHESSSILPSLSPSRMKRETKSRSKHSRTDSVSHSALSPRG